MKIDEYLAQHDLLEMEETYFSIPLRKDYILGQIGRAQRVLDVGCLGGRFSLEIQKQHNEVWGIEINEAAAEIARSRGIKVKVADVQKGIPFDSGVFDVVHAGEILEHIYDTKHFFTEAYRVLKPGGQLLLTVFNLNSLENRWKVLRGHYLSEVGAYPEDHFGHHVRVFNLEKLQELCEQSGFRVEDVRGIPLAREIGLPIKLPRLSIELPVGLTRGRKWGFTGNLTRKSLSLIGRVLPEWSKILVVKAAKPA